MKIYLYTLILLIGSLVSAQNKVTVGILSDVPLKGKTQLLIDLKEEIIAVVGQDVARVSTVLEK